MKMFLQLINCWRFVGSVFGDISGYRRELLYVTAPVFAIFTP